MAFAAADADDMAQPATLHGVMQMMIGDGLRRHYQAPNKLSHELFVLLMQLREEERKTQPSPAPSKPRQHTSRQAR
jgi:hypothetical protein